MPASCIDYSSTLKLKNGVFWVVTPCGSCKNHRFGGTWRLLHQGDKNRCTRRRQFPPKRRFLQEPHGVTTQKTPFFIVTAVKTSNLTLKLVTCSCELSLIKLHGATSHKTQHIITIVMRTSKPILIILAFYTLMVKTGRKTISEVGVK
jgi:hypothetical protein